MNANPPSFRRAHQADEPRLQAIRRVAFAPIFASFRALLGDAIYDIAQRREDQGQEALLTSLLAPDCAWEVFIAEEGSDVAGFVAVRLDNDTQVGEIGLNAVDPACAGRGIGTAMYEFAVGRMKQAGMKVAVVGTGGDESHAAARAAYRKAGFTAEIPSVWMCRKL